jgi:hypothetical protein
MCHFNGFNVATGHEPVAVQIGGIMSNELAVIGNQTSLALADVMQIGRVMSESGFFKDSSSAAQAVVKILAGQELGFGPFASMTGIHIIQGRPSVGANLMAAAVKSSGRYDYRVLAMDDTICEIAFFERGQEIGKSRFTLQDAQKAGTQNLGKFPRNMLFARAMSNGVRWYCPNVFSGAAVYTPEELGATVNEDGVVIQGSVEPEQPADIAGYAIGDAVTVAGKTGVKTGQVIGLDFDKAMVQVAIDGNGALWLKPDKLSRLEPVQPELIEVGDPGAFDAE